VRTALDRGLPANEITATMVNLAATEQIGRAVTLHEAIVQACLDPMSNVRARAHAGGPAPDAVRKVLADLATQLHQAEAENTVRREFVAKARAYLRCEVADRARS
jgi:argininosuccinate lyase